MLLNALGPRVKKIFQNSISESSRRFFPPLNNLVAILFKATTQEEKKRILSACSVCQRSVMSVDAACTRNTSVTTKQTEHDQKGQDIE